MVLDIVVDVELCWLIRPAATVRSKVRQSVKCRIIVSYLLAAWRQKIMRRQCLRLTFVRYVVSPFDFGPFKFEFKFKFEFEKRILYWFLHTLKFEFEFESIF